MINKLKQWIGRTAAGYAENNHPVPHIVANNHPVVQVFKISNGYLLHRSNNRHYREEEPNVLYCATPMDVARHIVNSEALDKLGISSSDTPSVLGPHKSI